MEASIPPGRGVEPGRRETVGCDRIDVLYRQSTCNKLSSFVLLLVVLVVVLLLRATGLCFHHSLLKTFLSKQIEKNPMRSSGRVSVVYLVCHT